MLPKDNENVPLPFLTADEIESSRPQAFAHDQLVTCEKCLRTNPPTRLNCLYCGAGLPLNQTTSVLQKPTLRRLEKWEQGYNNILLPDTANPGPGLSEAEVAEVAGLLKLDSADLVRITSLQQSLPLARSATREEALLVQGRLSEFRIDTRIIADSQLGAEDAGSIRVRAAEISESSLTAYQQPGAPPMHILWSDIVLVVVGRLITKRVESRERKSSGESQILNSSEFFDDETAVSFFTRGQPTPYRITAKSFDFSCLKEKKGLLAEQNMTTLLALFRDRVPQADWDESYNLMRKALDAVWPPEQQNESGGWRRDRPGKLSKGSVTEISNEGQFVKYARLRYCLREPAQL